jgi:hypothetical protein
MIWARFFICLAVGLYLTLIGNAPRSAPLAQTRAPVTVAGVQPVLRLEKPRYILGESVRFWVGALPKDSSVIPEEFRKPCSLTIIKPDGTTKTQSVGWPVDGIAGAAWYGGWGFGDDRVEVGSYILVLNCGGEKTPPVDLIVERNDISDQIKTKFRFERSGVIKMGTPVSVTLTVQNDSENTLRFPQRGAMAEGVSVRVVRDEPAFHSAFFYPSEKLGDARVMPDTCRWDVASEVPSVVLKTGEHFEQHFSLEEAYSFDQPGNYEVTFATVLGVLVGEKNGPFADLCPIRFPVVADAKFVVSRAD